MKKITLTALAISIAVGGMGFSTAVMAKPGSMRGGQMPSFEMLDTNGDGVITQTEINAIGAGRFAESDANGDGYLDADELKAQMLAKGAERRAKRDGKGDRGSKRDEGNTELRQTQMGERMDLAIKHMIERADTNGDGKLSADEVKSPQAGKLFEHVDVDGNGEITQEEWDAAKAKRGGHRRRSN
ncbi:MAG: EF-hand domain-containing protein [Paracoccaceae bacterium]